MTGFIISLIVCLVIYSVFITIVFLKQNANVDILERTIFEQKKYITAYNEWYKPESLDELNKSRIKEAYDKRLKELQESYKNQLEFFERNKNIEINK